MAAQGGAAFQGGLAEVRGRGIILERGQIVDTQEWTRQVEIVALAPTLQGRPRGSGPVGTTSLRITGHFTATAGVSLDLATLTHRVAARRGGRSRRARARRRRIASAADARHGKGGKPAQAIYGTASGVRPSVRAEVKSRDPEIGQHGVFRHGRPRDGSSARRTARPAIDPSEPPDAVSLQGGGGAPVGMEITVPAMLGHRAEDP